MRKPYLASSIFYIYKYLNYYNLLPNLKYQVPRLHILIWLTVTSNVNIVTHVFGMVKGSKAVLQNKYLNIIVAAREEKYPLEKK